MRNYITKINDRNLQRKKASGITNYVLYSILIIVIFKLIDLLPKISEDFSSLTFVEIIMYSLNSSLAIYMIYESFLSSIGNSSSLRVLKNSKESESYFKPLIESLLFVTPTIPTIYIAFNNFNDDVKFSPYLIFMSILSLFNIILAIAVLFTKDKDRYKIYKGTNDSKSNTLSIIILIISVIVITYSINLLFNLNSDLDKLNLFIFGFLAFSILVILQRIIDNYSSDIFTKDLENLEYEIYVKNLSDNQIRHILQHKYMGFLINDWITNKEDEISSELDLINTTKVNLTKERNELSKVDKEKYPIEYNGRLEKIENEEFNLKMKISTFFLDSIAEVDEIVKKDNNISKSEKEKLIKLKKDLEKNLKKLT
ncbi:hypothetical protein H4O20_07090 [Aequorivita sp. 609]|uniref:hypothetical protein n=1 Tax=Aequorivita TaxID=153265 RepID=UPI00161A95FE|nr:MULTISPECIES: hypothetical protein [Aequorivita]MBB6681206.1 hypothetical protein [Aequorivita sp. 609]